MAKITITGDVESLRKFLPMIYDCMQNPSKLSDYGVGVSMDGFDREDVTGMFSGVPADSDIDVALADMARRAGESLNEELEPYTKYKPVTQLAKEIFSRTVPVSELIESKPMTGTGPAIEGCVIPVVNKIEPKQSESEKLQSDLEPLP